MSLTPHYQLMGILGGTFNPIHHGHLRMAQEVAEQLHFDQVKFIPSANPPHKPTPEVSAVQRAEMIKLAIADNPLFSLDTRELERNDVSYTVDTLKSLYAEHSDTALCLILGSDAFLKFDTWHHWQEIIQYCHIILVQRPQGTSKQGLNKTLEAFMRDHYTEDTRKLAQLRAGLMTMQSITALEISSSQIRHLIRQQQSALYLSPQPVINYLMQNKLYL
ncbi:MAG: nicotinate-nucleotide adenylyltransferase [Methylophilus sp.]|nr:nicotinate-nucleotide adenylyltransferase [Methylophilus sp.]